MRILYLSQLVPYPPDAGPKVRIYHVLQYLASAGHDLTLVAFCRPEDKPEQLDHLRRFCREIYTVPMLRSRWRDIWQLGRSLLQNRPFLITRDEVPAMTHLLRELVSQNPYDAVHADQLWMAQYALSLTENSPSANHPMRVLDQHNAVFLIPQRLAAASGNPISRALLNLEEKKMAAYEKRVCQQFDHVAWVTDDDRAALAQGNGRIKGTTIPICIDPDAHPPLQRKPGAKRVTFMGGLHWPPNSQGVVWFTQEVWPQILSRVPEAIFTVIGKSPPTLPGMEQSVEVTGYVADPEPYLAETAAFVVPLHAGGGMRVKILDAWRLGLPVVSTTIGAEGIHYENGRDLLIADDPDAFADDVVRLLCESSLANKIGKAGRKAVETHYDWHTVYRAWDTIYGTTQQ
ncbi:MAG: glycosyltransferase family 4 protein [Candidatus Promineifilaceae bacterium]